MQDLAAWLLEQLAKDRRIAEGVPESARSWHHDQPYPHIPEAASALDLGVGSEGSFLFVAGPETPDDPATTVSNAEATHIATWDPARVLAECDAKRRIVELYRFLVGHDGSTAVAAALLDVLKEFGAAYAQVGRPGYREEWRPVDDGWAEPFTDR